MTPTHWMKYIDDSVPLYQLTIPGTHDSCARFGGPAFACQTLSISEQLNLGIRALDIRCRHVNNGFPIYHSSTDQRIDFGDVQKSCIDFLQANPSETIVMHIKQESTVLTPPQGNNETFQLTFNKYIIGFGEFWYLKRTIPTLGDARGKIILLRRFELDVPDFERDDPEFIEGIDVNPWIDNATFAIYNFGVGLIIQDRYGIGTIDDKWNVVEEFLNRAAVDQASQLLYLNFTSAAGYFPANLALGDATHDEGINQKLFNFLSKIDQPTHFGFVYLNFPESPDNLVPLIFRNNKFGVMKKPNIHPAPIITHPDPRSS